MDQPDIIDILLIEDNSDEVGLISKIIDVKEWNVNFNIVNDGIEAMNYLHKKGKYYDCVKPSLILLDLNLPKKNGSEVLKEIKTDDILKCIPVIVLTSSDDDNDIIESYGHHANAYIIKPPDFDMFEKYILIFKDFWFNSAKLPK
ncbi:MULTISPECIES: response regulator [Methanobacterium]|uniref:Response regulatory domain-containing protein n=1 Tax=Methanobacterium bryantii TaxID=2161 RepID=A0A2A2H734_METBR|nr:MULTISPECIES: response regulator [Methanobacterium]PAV05090.1 hypothetical protein ASJ80_12430 [Methanobacterium bryantii]